MASVTAILQQAQSADFATRSAAEQELLRLEASDYGAFVTELATLLANEEAPVDVRQLAAILLKNSVASRGGADGAGVAERWRAQVSAGQRTAVHEALLEALGSVRGGTPVRRQVAQALAKVAGLDLPTGAWPELIERLVQPMLQPGDGYARRHGSVEALGFLSEEGALAEVLSRWSDAILTAVVQGMRGGGEAPTTTPANKEVLAVQRAATGALFNALAFVAHNFENERERDIIMLTVMAAAASPADWGLRRDAFECLVGIASRYYDKLALRSPGSNNLTYIELLFQLTLEAIQNDCDEVAMQAIEFWSTVADEEASRLEEAALHLSNAVCLRIVEQAVAPLLPVLLQSMVRNGDGADGHAAADEDDAEQPGAGGVAAARGGHAGDRLGGGGGGRGDERSEERLAAAGGAAAATASAGDRSARSGAGHGRLEHRAHVSAAGSGRPGIDAPAAAGAGANAIAAGCAARRPQRLLRAVVDCGGDRRGR
eukprot:ctg_1196.g381